MQKKMNAQVASAYNTILKKIISYDMEPERQVSDAQLAKELGMSRAPVREAILLLTMDGLIQKEQSGKTVVTPIRFEDISDILHVRRALESEAIRLIAANGWLKEAQKNNLKKIQAKFTESADISAVSEHYQYDDQFHSAITAASESQRIIDILERMRLQMERARWLNLVAPGRQAAATVEHQQLLDAMLRKDLDGSISALNRHLDNSEDTFRAAMKDKQIRLIAMTISNFFSDASS